MDYKKTFYHINKYLWLLFIFIFFSPAISWAVPAYDGLIELQQPLGYSFEARQKGDEWYNWFETKDGYGISHNQDNGNWEYLVPSGEKNSNASSLSLNIMTEIVVGEVYPSTLGIPKGLRPPKKTSPSMLTSKITSEAMSLQAPVSGTKNLLVIGVDYSDQPANYSVTQIQPLFFGSSGSVADYFSNISYSNVGVSPATESHGTANDGFVGWIRVSGSHPNTGSSIVIANQQIAKDAIVAADPYIDYSQYDTNGNSIIETTELSIIIIVAGYEASISGSLSPSVWGHKSSMWGVGNPSVDGKTIIEYAQIGERHGANLATIGIMCHELGHLMFSLPDLYDTVPLNGDSAGIGGFGLMGTGSWGAASGSNAGSSPTHLCAWSKESLGWGTVTTILSGQSITFPKADGNSASIFRINTTDPNQYFLIENRQSSGYDIGFQRWTGASGHGGLVIYHIDKLKTVLWPGSNTVNADENDKGVDIEEANEGSLGKSKLDENESRADTDMFYFSGNNSSFTDSTLPNSKLKNGTSTNISVINISNYGDIMTADVLTSGSQSKTFTIYNDGLGILNITDIIKENNSSWLSFSPPPPFSINSGNSQNVTVIVNPSLANYGTNTDRLIVYSNDPDENPYPNGVNITLTVDDTIAPIVTNLSSSKATITEGVDNSITISAIIDDTSNGNSNIAAAEYYIGNSDPGEGNGTAMNAVDGTFNSIQENVQAIVNTSSWIATNSPYQINVRGKDDAGNWGTIQTVSVTVDMTGQPSDNISPTVDITSPCNSSCPASTSLITIGGSATDSGGSGLDKVYVYNQTTNSSSGWDNSVSGNSASFSVAGITLTSDTNTIKARAYDVAGNVSSEDTIIVTYNPPDTNGPSLNITSHNNEDHVNTSSITLRGNATDEGLGNNGIEKVTVNGIRANNDTASGNVTANWNIVVNLNLGANPITVMAYDNSNNKNITAQVITIYYDSPLAVSTITPSFGKKGQSVTANIAGSGFKKDATVKLTKAGQTYIDATNVTVVSSIQITCAINLAGAKTGEWNVVVTNPDNQSATLPNMFTVAITYLDEVIIDFGKIHGAWILMNNSKWKKLHKVSPEIMTTGDMDGNGKGEVVIDFGPGIGIWIMKNDTSWQKLHPLRPETMVTGDTDGNGKDEVVIDFGPGIGIWIRRNDASWQKLHPLSPETMVTGDMDGNGKDEVIIDFGPGIGIWIMKNDASWQKLHPLSPETMVTGDMDGNGKDEVVIDFGPGIGIWIRRNNASWQKLHPLSPETMVTGDMDGNGKDEVIIDFGTGIGMWIMKNNASWQKLHPLSPETMVTGDMDGNGKDEVIIDFGTGIGMWIMKNNASWQKLHPLSPEVMATGDMDGN
ncbi:MAG: M6 family metalloprotease domain-containing protein [Candidatus Scalinduaceae bacterium]